MMGGAPRIASSASRKSATEWTDCAATTGDGSLRPSTRVGTVDTQVAQHLLRAAAAVRLMGAECIISGISPMIAQTMVQLGIDVGTVSTRSSIRTALADALQKVGYVIKTTEGA